MFKLNEANWDRIVRVVAGILLIYLGWAGVVSGGLGVLLLVIGAVLLLTGLVGFCPLYALLKFSTKST
jgi:Inner membrane protein YgaP-like, transmembrane domain